MEMIVFVLLFMKDVICCKYTPARLKKELSQIIYLLRS